MASGKPHTVIIGAGIGGLTLAQALRKKGLTFEIFERDNSPSARDQGFAIGLYEYRPLCVLDRTQANTK